MESFRFAWLIALSAAVGAGCSLITPLSGLEGPGSTDAGRSADVAPSLGNDAASPDDVASTVADASVLAADAGDVDNDADASTARDASDDTFAPPSDADADADAPSDAASVCAADVWADPANCGACSHDCLGGACTAGACAPLVLAVTHDSVGIAIDTTYVYWADSEAGVVNKLSKALTHAGTPTAVASGAPAANVQGLATDGTYVYWTNKTAAGQVHRALPTGAGLIAIASNQSQPDWVAANGSIVVWTNQGSNQVMAVPASTDGGVAPTQLNASGELGTVPAGLAVDGTDVYYATKIAGGGLAESAPLDGGAVSEIGTGSYVGIATDTARVFWTGGAASPGVYWNTKGAPASAQQTLVTGAFVCPLSLASDGTNVYFIDQGSTTCGPAATDAGALYKVPAGAAGQLPTQLAGGLLDPQGIAVDDTALYWVTGGPTGAVMKLAK